MTEAIKRFFLETVGRELCVFFCSMLPIIECRGAVPLGWGLGMPWWQTAIFSIAGNLLPVPFILLFIRAVLKWMLRVPKLAPIAEWIHEKAAKNSKKVMKYATFGLFLFVAIPIPGTGAWTGALVAALLDMRMKYALPSIFLGVLTAGFIMTAGSSLVAMIF